MEINNQIIKQLRIDRNWTQQHLADACDISLRTVQRIEKFGNASTESVMSLCAVFEINKQDICTVPKVKPQQLETVTVKSYFLLMLVALSIGVVLGAFITYFLML
ncbi:helix-turn-helix domain-containing protein [Paraglaciecola aquimarina]|uniref:Helix-turn-helix domain-containing protein n=1 Tax=Paraglaciecola algarum TaxID=3050085 RepID=A0ABS9D6L9_9ALTE|nr:helix-turn-helix transcriptional regulator [Paraglaciecola sp. G1-23]MCF2948545.1 helix-turn-helix domain-containing protein [Paraglaciecola sp. G1-23]